MIRLGAQEEEAVAVAAVAAAKVRVVSVGVGRTAAGRVWCVAPQTSSSRSSNTAAADCNTNLAHSQASIASGCVDFSTEKRSNSTLTPLFPEQHLQTGLQEVTSSSSVVLSNTSTAPHAQHAPCRPPSWKSASLPNGACSCNWGVSSVCIVLYSTWLHLSWHCYGTALVGLLCC